MTSVNANAINSTGGSSIQERVAAGVNVSDAMQMENNFISLMVAQIQNQDPSSPMDSGEFLNQFAAMSQVKSLENMASLSQNNLLLLDNLQTLTAAGLVNRQVKARVEQLTLDGSKVSGRLELAHASGDTRLRLTDGNGVVSEIKLGRRAPGELPFEIDPRALGLSDGTYKIEALTDSGEQPQVEVAGLVNRVRVGEQGPELDLAGIGKVPFYALTEFG